MIGACSATSSSRNPSASTTPMTSGVLADSSCFEVVVLGDRAADQRTRRQRGAQPIDGPADGLGRRVGVGDRLHQGRAAGAGHGRHDLRDAGVGLGDRGHALRRRAGW